jgi:hypothetical protein
MSTELPQSVATFFRIVNESDPKAFLTVFSENAVVWDEGHEYHGTKAIKEWSDRHLFRDHVTFEVRNAVQSNNETVVTTKVDGTYDKTGLPNPLLLDLRFGVKNNKIAALTFGKTVRS